MSDNNDQNQSSVTEHLLELRSRIIKSLIFFAIAFIISYMNADKIYDFLLQPYVKALGVGQIGTKRLIFTALQETFITYLKLSFFFCSLFFFPCFFDSNLEIYSSWIISKRKKNDFTFYCCNSSSFYSRCFIGVLFYNAFGY